MRQMILNLPESYAPSFGKDSYGALFESEMLTFILIKMFRQLKKIQLKFLLLHLNHLCHHSMKIQMVFRMIYLIQKFLHFMKTQLKIHLLHSKL